MKTTKFVIFIVLLLSFSLCKAQNYIGQSKSRIINELKKEFDFGVIQDVSESEEFILKYINFNGTITKYFYFDEKGKCLKFTIINKNIADYKSTVKDLNRRFQKKERSLWIEKGQTDCQWKIDKKDKFFALIVTRLG